MLAAGSLPMASSGRKVSAATGQDVGQVAEDSRPIAASRVTDQLSRRAPTPRAGKVIGRVAPDWPARGDCVEGCRLGILGCVIDGVCGGRV